MAEPEPSELSDEGAAALEPTPAQVEALAEAEGETVAHPEPKPFGHMIVQDNVTDPGEPRTFYYDPRNP
jgi:hypothetical protein